MTISEFTAQIQTWQERASGIAPPAGRTPSRGGLTGPAFFPEGLGLAHAGDSRFTFPTAIVVGHNFSSTAYRDDIENRFAGSEEKQVTYSNLKDILDRANLEVAGSKLTIGSCFMTNFFVGLIESKESPPLQSGRRPSYENEGRFIDPAQDDENASYIQHCAALLRDEIACIAPRVILFLGKDVVRYAREVTPLLECWRWERPKEFTWSWIHNGDRTGGAGCVVQLPPGTLCPNAVWAAALVHLCRGKTGFARRTNEKVFANLRECLLTDRQAS